MGIDRERGGQGVVAMILLFGKREYDFALSGAIFMCIEYTEIDF